MPTSHSMQQDAAAMEDMDPQMARELQQKRQYVERLRAQLRSLKEENEALA